MKKVLFEVNDQIALITINRPEAMNALDPETFHLLSEAWCEVRDNPEICVAIITGAGEKAFSAGADLKTTIPRKVQKHDFWMTQKEMMLNRGLEVWKPIIAAVNGYCLGGGMTLLMATDVRIATESAVFELSEVKRGVLPGGGGTQRLLRQVPYCIAMEMILLGRRFSADEALRWGLINKIVQRETLIDTALKYAHAVRNNAPLATQAAKELVVRSQSLPLDQGLRLEAAMFELIRNTEDAKEGPTAFAEKRLPIFKGE
jgi:E-phenylitaconyl-CoA hydratase